MFQIYPTWLPQPTSQTQLTLPSPPLHLPPSIKLLISPSIKHKHLPIQESLSIRTSPWQLHLPSPPLVLPLSTTPPTRQPSLVLKSQNAWEFFKIHQTLSFNLTSSTALKLPTSPATPSNPQASGTSSHPTRTDSHALLSTILPPTTIPSCNSTSSLALLLPLPA